MAFPAIVRYDEQTKQTYLFYDEDHVSRVDVDPLAYINALCLNFGTTMQGREDAFRMVTGFHSKACILLSETKSVMYMPLFSKMRKDNIWLEYSQIMAVHGLDGNHTLVLFASGYKIELGVNYRIIKKQMLRCETFLKKLYARQLKSIEVSYDNMSFLKKYYAKRNRKDAL